MKRAKDHQKKSLQLRKETLRQIDQGDLGQVAGGAFDLYAYLKACGGTWIYTK